MIRINLESDNYVIYENLFNDFFPRKRSIFNHMKSLAEDVEFEEIEIKDEITETTIQVID